MRFRFLQVVTVCALGAFSAFAQAPPPVAPRSHVERFTAPTVRAERAEAAATTKINANPNDAEAFNERSLARMRLGRYAEAYEDLRHAVTLKPKDAEYQANLGYVLWKLGRAAEAVNAERATLALDDKNFTAHYQLGRFLLRLGDPKQLPEAAAQLKRALELDARQTEVRFELLAAYRAIGDTAQAAAQLEILQDARPSDARVIYVRALLASDRNDLNAAIKDFREAVRVDPTLVGAWQDLGVAYIKQQNWNEAITALSEAAHRQPNSPEIAYFNALALFKAQRDEDAERAAQRTLSLSAGNAPAYTLLGIVLFTRGNANVQARDALTQAVALDPNSFDAYYYLGRVQGDMKDFTGAANSLQRAVALDPHHQFARFLLGNALESKGEYAAALAEYQELVKIDPNSAFGQMGLGALLVKEGKRDEAITALQRAITLDSSLFEAHWALGRALVQAGRLTEAAESFQKSIAAAPYRPDGHYQLALTLQKLGRKEEAAREFAIVSRITTAFRTGNANPEQ